MTSTGRFRISVCALLLATMRGALALPVGDPIVGPDGNLIANGQFMARDPEQRPLRWVSGPGLQTALITRAQHHSENKDDCSLKVADASTTDRALVRSEKRIANPGTAYVAKAWVKGGSGTPASLYLEFWDQNAARIGVTSVTPPPSDSWQEVAATLPAPDHATHVSVAISSTVEGTGVSYWDDVSLVPQIAYDPRLALGRRELFIDNYRLESWVDVQRVAHPGIKSAPLISATQPWEGKSVYIYGTVLKDEPAGTGYRMWYTGYSGDYYLCYATSVDGLTWTKPNLGIVEYHGSKENNIVHIGGGTVVFDPADHDPGRRYKLMRCNNKISPVSYWVYFSPDGLNWTAHAGNPVLTYGDVSNVAYDQAQGLFIATTKQRMLVSNTSVTPGKMDRAAFVSISKDFVHWTAPGAPGSPWTLAVEGDQADDFIAQSKRCLEAQIYGMPVYPYEGIYVGLPWVFEISNYTSGRYAVTGDGTIQPQIAASRDLRHWSRPNRDPVLPLGQAGSWDDGTLYTASTMQVSAHEIGIYFGAMNLPHGADTSTQIQTAKIGRATWRRDGFVSLRNGGNDEGLITTRPILVAEAARLKVNARMRAGGGLKVEILDPAGPPVSGYDRDQSVAITGDQPAGTIRWTGSNDLSALSGKTIRLRFHLNNGDLYSYWFE